MATKKTKRKTKKLPPRGALQFRRHKDEPFLTKAHKILIFVVALGTVIGMGWNALSKADARYTKEAASSKVHQQLSNDLAMLSQAFQAESIDRLIEYKRDKIRDLNRRLRMKIPDREKFEIQEDIKAYEQEIESLQKKQEKLR